MQQNESHTDMVEELSKANMENISSQKGVHNEEEVKVCWKPSYQIRKLRNKGAIIILVWNFLAISTYSYLEKATNVPYAKHIGK